MIWLLLTWMASPLIWIRLILINRPSHKRILVIQTNKIGDFVASTPVFRALSNRFPCTEIVALLHPINIPLARQLDSIDRIVVLPSSGFKGLASKLWLFGILTEGYDSVLILSPNLTNLLVSFWAGVPTRVSVLGDRRQSSLRLAWPFLTHGEPHRPGQMFRETALRALVGLKVQVDGSLLNQPNEIHGNPTGQDRLINTGARLWPRPLVGIGLGAGNRMKALDLEQLVTLTKLLVSRTTATLILIGTNADRTAANALIEIFPFGRIIDTTAQWPLDELPFLLGMLDCFVGVDSGATYMADALDVPVVDFMGPANAEDQRPIGKKAVVIRSSEPCAPCSHAFDAPYSCHLGTRACITKAPVELLADRVVQLLSSWNPNAIVNL